MSQANDLLNSISEPTAGTVAEGNLIIGRDRYITVPESLKKVAVQFDHNVETVTFDCPRYWDEWDFATMKIYINYMREDGKIGMHWCQNVVVDSEDSNMIHFDWTISGHVTAVQGHISFLVCVKNVDTEGTEITHWNSELNTEMYVSEGLKCQPTILKHYPDIITQLLVRMETAEKNLQTWIAKTEKEIADWEAALKKDINTWETNTYKKMDTRMKTAEGNTTPAEILRRINNALDTNAETQQQIYDAAADYLRDGIVATGKIEKETNAYLEENLAIIADDLLDITLENTIEKSGVVIPSGEGNMLPVKIMGDSYQKQYSGNQLLDASKIPTKSQGGATVTNNGDGSFTVSGSGLLSKAYDNIYTLSHESFVSLFKAGKVYLKTDFISGPYLYIQIRNASGIVKSYSLEQRLVIEGEILQSYLDDESIYMVIGFYGFNNMTINNNTIRPMIYQDGDGTWEPFCGGVPSPNPEFPQEIENVGVVRNLLDCSGLVETVSNGITFTPVYDENGLLEYIEANGTASADAYKSISKTYDNYYYNSYILSGCPSGGSSSSYRLIFQKLDADMTWKSSASDLGSGVLLDDEYPKHRIEICIKSGYTANKLRFYPMIRPASIADPTYHPYIPENKENLLEGVTIESGTIDTVNGTNADNASYNRTILAPMTPGKYVFSCVGIWSQVVRIFFYKNDEYISFYDFKSYSETFEVPEGTTHFRIRYQITEGLTGLIIRPHHIPAQGSQYAVEVKSVGKNLLKNNVKSSTSNGLTYTNENEKLHLSGTTTALTNLFSVYENFVLKKGIYMLGCEIGGNVSGNLMLYSKSNAVLAICSVSVPKQFEITEDTAIDRFVLQIQSGVTLNGNLGVILNRGTELLPFEPYRESRTVIHLDEPLRGIGEYRDTICQKDGVWGVERVIGEEVFDGSSDEDWRLNSCDIGNRYRYIHYKTIAVSDKSNGITSLNSNFTIVGPGDTYKTTNVYTITVDDLWVSLNGTETLEEFKAYLAESPMTLEYTLATPTFTPFEDQKQFWKMMAFDGATTISIIDGSDNTVPVGVFRIGRNQDGGKLLSHHSTLNNMEDLEGKITPIPILQADYDKLPESKKKNGIYIITDANVTSFTGNTVRYTGGREGLGDTVDKAISTVDEKVEEHLTASDGTKFRFGVNEKGEYGYIVTDSEGADTFFPFKNLERDTPATAIASDITKGMTAWVNGVLIVGTRPAPTTSQTGSVNVGFWGNGNWTATVIFPTPFDVVPSVSATFAWKSNGGHCTGHKIYNVTRTGFEIIAYGDGDGSQGITGTCNWYARL